MKEKLTTLGVKTLLAPIRWIIITALLFFLAAGGISSLRAWIYIAIYTIGAIVTGILLFQKTPRLLNERGKIQEGTKQHDKYLILVYFFIAIGVIPLVAGIDIKLHNGDTLPFCYLYVAIGLYLLSALFSVWPMVHNPFFETTLRIQEEKGHKVITTGPYKIIRHPGYLGMILSTASLPLALGSRLSLIPTLIAISLIFLRTHYEDTTLQRELPGYIQYTKKVKYKLIPFVW